MQLSKALEGFVVSKQADGMIPETITLYNRCISMRELCKIHPKLVKL